MLIFSCFLSEGNKHTVSNHNIFFKNAISNKVSKTFEYYAVGVAVGKNKSYNHYILLRL